MDVMIGLARAIVAILMLSSAVLKVRRFDDFQRALVGYKLLPPASSKPAAIAIVAAEFAAGLLAAAGVTAGYVAAGLLIAIYAAAMAINLLRGRRHIDCGCGGEPQPIGWWLVTRNVALISICLVAMRPLPAFGVWDYLTLAAGLATCAFVYATFNQLVRNQSLLTEWVRR